MKTGIYVKHILHQTADKGFAIIEFTYDDNGNQVSEIFYGVNEEVLEKYISVPVCLLMR